MFEILTNAQLTTMSRSAIGQSAKEIADKTNSTEHTVNTHLKNIKDRIKEVYGKTYKLSELRFLFLCEVLGKSSHEVKERILAISMCIVFLTTINYDHLDKRRFRLTTRKENVLIESYITI